MNWYYDEPTDETADWNRRVVMSEEQILEQTADLWTILGEPRASKQRLLEWRIVNWASPTDMPPGVYVTSSRVDRCLS